MSDINEAELRRIDLNLLVVFSVVMRERNVTRAAKELCVSQAAVSAALGRLRRLFNDRLFIRAPGGMAPTVRAQELARQVAPALRALAEAITESQRFDPERSYCVFTLGMSDDLEAHVMPRLVQMLQTRYPHVTLIARQANRLVIGRMLDDGEVDVGIVASPVLGTQHRQEPLFESGYRCIFDGPRLGLTGPLTLDAFLRYRHVLVSFDGRRGIVDDLLDAEGLSRTVLSATTHFAGVIVMLKAVDAIATIPEHSALAYAKAANLTTSPPPIRMPTFVVSLVWHASRAADPRNTWLRRQIMEFQL